MCLRLSLRLLLGNAQLRHHIPVGHKLAHRFPVATESANPNVAGVRLRALVRRCLLRARLAVVAITRPDLTTLRVKSVVDANPEALVFEHVSAERDRVRRLLLLRSHGLRRRLRHHPRQVQLRHQLRTVKSVLLRNEANRLLHRSRNRRCDTAVSRRAHVEVNVHRHSWYWLLLLICLIVLSYHTLCSKKEFQFFFKHFFVSFSLHILLFITPYYNTLIIV